MFSSFVPVLLADRLSEDEESAPCTLRTMLWRPTFSKSATLQVRFGYAVVGLGHIAEYFLKGLRDSPTVAVTTLVSGDPVKAARLARRYGVPRVVGYDQMDSLRDDITVDAVYIATPVSTHRQLTERGAAAGKHVLCEKPLAATAADAVAMIAACRAAGVVLSVAYRCPHDPMHVRARELVRSGALGRVLRIESAYGIKLGGGWRTDPALAGGGSLYDVGIYCLNAARYLLGEDPVRVSHAQAVRDERGLEREVQWTSEFASGAKAVCTSSYVREMADTLRIVGERGWLQLAPAFGHRERFRLRGEVDGQTIDERTPKSLASHFRLEAEHLAAVVRGSATLLTPGEDGLADMVAMEAIYAAAHNPDPTR